MSEAGGPKCYVIDRKKLDPDFPSQCHSPQFWEELGRTIASFGFLEEMLGKAIYALTGSAEFDPNGNPEAFNNWIKTLEKALTDTLGALVTHYERALSDNPKTQTKSYINQIVELRQANTIRNALCHGSWGKPDDDGRTVPKFVNRSLEAFDTPIDANYLCQTRVAVRHMIFDVVDSLTGVGIQFPGWLSPAEQLWPNPADVLLKLP